MKIAVINSVCNGSTGSIASNLKDALKKQGHEVKAFYGRFKSDKTDWEFIGGNNLITRINNLFVYVTGNVGGFHKGNTKRLIKELNDFNPDVIHIHNIHNNYLNFKLFFTYLSSFKGKIIFTLHDQFLLTGRCAYTKNNCEKYLSGCGNCPHKEIHQHVLVDKSKKLFKEKVEYFSKLNNFVLVSPSKWLDDYVSKSYLGKYNHIVINNGIDLPTVKLEKNPVDKIRLLFVSFVWSELKGPNYINELYKILDLNKYEITVVGDVEIGKQPFDECVNYVGKMNKDQLLNAYVNSEIFVDPTLLDNFPTVLIESLSCGLPVISFDTGGCKEIVGDAGIITKEKTAKALKEAIENFDFTKYSKEKCLKQAQKFTKENMINNYCEIYFN